MTMKKEGLSIVGGGAGRYCFSVTNECLMKVLWVALVEQAWSPIYLGDRGKRMITKFTAYLGYKVSSRSAHVTK